MIDCTFFDADGRITQVAQLSEETFEYYVDQGATALVDVLGDPETQYVVDNQLVDFTPEEITAKRNMPEGWAWKMPERVAVYVGTLEQAKARKNAEINAARLIANRSYFMYLGKKVACDELSRSDIDAVNGVVTLLGFVPIEQWKTLDNTYVAIPDKAAWIQFYMAMVGQGQANFDRAQTLKQQLADAQDAAEVEAITWDETGEA